MEQQQREENLQDDTNAHSLHHIEEIILVSLRVRNLSVGHTIDIVQLQEDFMSIGYSPRELSQGLVRLLMRQYLRPCGEITFTLTQAGRLAGEQALLACRSN